MSTESPPSMAVDEIARTEAYRAKTPILRRLALDASDVYVVPRRDLPVANVVLPRFVDEIVRWRTQLGPATRICWEHPIGDPSLAALTAEEMEQLLGIVTSQVVVREGASAGGTPQLSGVGRVRPQAMTVAWRWSVRAICSFRRWRRILDALTTLPAAVMSGVHLIELPGPLSLAFRWPVRIDHLVRTLDERAPGATLGVCLPANVWARATLDKAWRQFREAAPTAGSRVPLRCLMASRWDGPQRSALLADLAEEWGLQFDCSLSAGATAASEKPYYTSTAYFGQPFDQRVPGFLVKPGTVVQMPRTPAGTLLKDARQTIDAVFDQPRADVKQRLSLALNHTERAGYHARLADNPAAVGDWHRFHVYNWAPPEPSALRLFECEASALAKRHSPRVAALIDALATHPSLLSGERFLELAFDTASTLAKPALGAIRGEQTDAHHYLVDGGRPGLTADSAQLLDVLPERLGITLELGYGAGLLARQVRARATRYFGVDLGTEQAKALRDLDASGLVADIHALPLRDRAFDTIIADNVLEHAAEPLAVLRELRRVIAASGALYAVIPVDARAPAFQIRTHLWKADEFSIRTAATLAGFSVREFRLLRYAELGVYGCFPASAGETSLVVLTPAAA